MKLKEAIGGMEGGYAVADYILIVGEGQTHEIAVATHKYNRQRLLERCIERGIKRQQGQVTSNKDEVLRTWVTS